MEEEIERWERREDVRNGQFSVGDAGDDGDIRAATKNRGKEEDCRSLIDPFGMRSTRGPLPTRNR